MDEGAATTAFVALSAGALEGAPEAAGAAVARAPSSADGEGASWPVAASAFAFDFIESPTASAMMPPISDAANAMNSVECPRFFAGTVSGIACDETMPGA